mgnify:CR=1 FL=1
MPSEAHVGARVGWAVVLGVGLCSTRAAFATGEDRDGDTVCDLDEDLDGDGNFGNDDTDGDGRPNAEDNDDDGDGFLTRDEDVNGDGDPTNDFTDILGEDAGPDYLNAFAPSDHDPDGHPSEAYGGDDCDDDRAGVHPGVEHDPLYDGQNWDCDDQQYEFDNDRDGYDSMVEIDGGDDCDDYDPEVHPGAVEDPSGVDVDCDGWTDSVSALVPNGGCDCDVGGGGVGFGLWVALGLARRRR